LFQQRIHQQYEKMEDVYNFHVVDATRTVEEQQQEVRQIIQSRLDLPRFKKRARVVAT
jgi:thymidylate kinase